MVCFVLQVTMSDRAAAERACKDPNPIIDGRKANVNLAYLGAKPRIQTGERLVLESVSSQPTQGAFPMLAMHCQHRSSALCLLCCGID